MAKVGIGGMPTDVDVERLRQQIGVPQPGDMVPYERITEIIGLERTTHRWRAVVVAWIKRLRRENNIVLRAVDNVGYKVLGNSERVDWVSGRIKQGKRRLVEAGRVAVSTDRAGLDAQHCRALDHAHGVVTAWVLAEATAARQLAYPSLEVKRLVPLQA